MRRPYSALNHNGVRSRFQTREDSGLFWNILVTPINLLGRKRHIECGTMTVEGGLGFSQPALRNKWVYSSGPEWTWLHTSVGPLHSPDYALPAAHHTDSTASAPQDTLDSRQVNCYTMICAGTCVWTEFFNLVVLVTFYVVQFSPWPWQRMIECVEDVLFGLNLIILV